MTNSRRYLLVTLLIPTLFVIGNHKQTSYAQSNHVSAKISGPILDLMKKSAPILLQESSALRSGNLAHLSNAVLKVTGEGKVEVTIHSRDPVGPEQQRDLVGLEATILEVAVTPPPELHLPRFGLVDVLIPLSRIEEAAELPWVTAITPPGYADSDSHPVNPTNSEGVAIHFADLAQSLGVDGTGVTIGVISSGVANLAIAQTNGELPAVTVFNSGGLDEGTAMLEIVHDMAPGATLLYDDGAGTSSSNITRHFNALINLAANGANVIAEDLFFNTEPMFQQGLLAQTAEALAASGISIHSSAGNRAQNHAARVVAVGTGAGPDGVNGPFTGCTVNPTNAVAITSVNGNDTTFDLVLGTDNTPPPSGPNGSVFVLQWSEPRQIFPSIGRGGFTNLDLFVMDAALTTCLGESSVVQQNGVGDTIEIVAMPAAMAGTPVKVVVNVTGTSSAVAPPTLDLRWVTTQSETNFPTAAGSLNPDSNYIGLASSSAAFLAGSSALATTSSQGPIQLGSTTICPGGLPGPCVGVAGPGLTSFPGPTWTAVSGVSISGAGGFGSPSATGACPAINPGDCRFFGTSAAAPHAAACDALVRDAIANPTSAVAPIAARLASTARFAGNGNVNAAGAGLLDCLDAVGPPNARCIANQTVPTDPGVCRVDSLIPIDNGSSDPNGDPIAISQTPAPPYLLGANVITLNVTETSAGALSDSCTTTITVIDEVPPEITAPDDIVAECTSPDGTPVDLGDPDVSDICDADVDVRNDAPDLFPLSATTVTWTAEDDSANQSSDTQIVTVEDTTPPVIACNNPGTVSPNDAPVTFTATAEDACAGLVDARISEFRCYTLTNKGRLIDKRESCIVSFLDDSITISDSGGVGDIIEWTVGAVDGNGNSSTETCRTEVVNPNF